MSKNHWLRLAREARATFVLALPVVVAQLLSVAMNVADTVLAGHLDTRVLAAVAMGYQVWVLALLIVIGLMLAVTPAVAQLDGAGRRAETGGVFRQALWIALALGLLLFLGLHQGAPALLDAFSVVPAIREDALAFLRAIAWGAFPLAIFFAFLVYGALFARLYAEDSRVVRIATALAHLHVGTDGIGPQRGRAVDCPFADCLTH